MNKLNPITTNNLEYKPKHLTCTTEREVLTSGWTRKVLENIISESSLDKNPTNQAVINLLREGVILTKHADNLKWLIEGMENNIYPKERIAEYIKEFAGVAPALDGILLDADGKPKTDDLLTSLRNLWENAKTLDYEAINRFGKYGIARVQGEKKKIGLVQKKNNGDITEILEPKYTAISPFDKYTIAVVETEVNGSTSHSLYGFIQCTEDGGVKVLMEPKYRKIYSFDENGIAQVEGEGRLYGFIKETAEGVEEIVQPKYKIANLSDPFHNYNGMAGNLTAEVSTEDGLKGFIQKTSEGVNEIRKPQYDDIGSCDANGVMWTKIDNKYGFIRITKEGIQEITKPQYDAEPERDENHRYSIPTM